MSEQDKVFDGSIPEFYDTYLVPLIFEAFADDLAERVVARSPQAVLELAAGSGVVTRVLAPLLSVESSYTVTDLNQPMLDYAATEQMADPRISWRQADAQMLPFEEGQFDVVLCQFGVMFFPDRIQAYRECKRVLRPGGTLIFNVWDRIEENEFAQEITQALTDLFPEDPPQFLARTPYGYYDPQKIEQDLISAGFSTISLTSREEFSTGFSPNHPAIAYCQGTPLRAEIEARAPDRLAEITEIATRAIADKFGEGPVSGRIRGHVIEAEI